MRRAQSEMTTKAPARMQTSLITSRPAPDSSGNPCSGPPRSGTQHLKAEEQKQLGWSAKRELSKINYRIHTDAIRQHLIPTEVTPAQASMIYAEEADVLNVAMFGITAKQ